MSWSTITDNKLKIFTTLLVVRILRSPKFSKIFHNSSHRLKIYTITQRIHNYRFEDTKSLRFSVRNHVCTYVVCGLRSAVGLQCGMCELKSASYHTYIRYMLVAAYVVLLCLAYMYVTCPTHYVTCT